MMATARATVNVRVADLPEVKATLDEAGRRLREQEATIQALIDQAADLGQQVGQLRRRLDEARQDAREDYARAEQAEQALVACRAEVERIKADAGNQAKTIEALAFEVWSGTQRCVYDRHENGWSCDRCRIAIASLSALGLDDRMQEWAS